ncbi:DinB family protein [Myroides ceti]|uniref:DinB family protein n=1 Tax=Paenimyroides ceti TaxID=395087 RepID=A0ABT8CXG1_9FLAO|nr:DinB family protein [Paenimyroides ceti]MDN3705642.1 DinB family protein [Paenimyroides ceti]MDN3708884.1 DinB family protein [Paenimyroides ceti]
MKQQQLIEQFYATHRLFLEYVNSLSPEAFMHTKSGKWNAGQQLSHIYLCLQPIAKALVSKDFLREKFGTLNRPLMDEAHVITRYKEALANGGKAPERFVPGAFNSEERDKATAETEQLLTGIGQLLQDYTEEELDTLVMPHPLLGPLSIREMMYLMTYHATHHQLQTEANLKS